MLTGFLASFFVFVFGLCIGSFLNCIIYRLEQKKKITGRSFCPNCKHKLSWQDLFPICSFLLLKGKCRYCHKKISLQYPLVELATGILFVLLLSLGLTFNTFYILVISCFFIIIFIYDLKHSLILDKVLFPAVAIALIYDVINIQHLLNALLAAVIASGFFLLIFLISKGRAMGFGDVKLAILIGLLLGMPNALVALFLAFFFGAVIGLALMVFKKKSLKSEIPFGPFLITGTLVTIFYGNQIIQWYLSLIMK